ncbi:hypothetical protein TNIN_425971 [Trichonephila inaurata madagascariensis]|uniref:Uncharacterized protein n=1 Tax=Trichonephila inaurata madagascariensis TaxID=2747483 RepID=A0A8X6YJC5_9ARAC|nr:hypothetical protein TNIN_425971 [Trichonephila inaurata madagascariensis]
MIALPTEVDELTDEGFDDTETLDPSVRDVARSIEISVPYENHDDHRKIYQTKVKNEVAQNQDQIHARKMWSLCGNIGYYYNFDLYCGKEVVNATSTVVLSKEPLGTQVVK